MSLGLLLGRNLRPPGCRWSPWDGHPRGRRPAPGRAPAPPPAPGRVRSRGAARRSGPTRSDDPDGPAMSGDALLSAGLRMPFSRPGGAQASWQSTICPDRVGPGRFAEFLEDWSNPPKPPSLQGRTNLDRGLMATSFRRRWRGRSSANGLHLVGLASSCALRQVPGRGADLPEATGPEAGAKTARTTALIPGGGDSRRAALTRRE